MDRRAFLFAAGATVLSWPASMSAQEQCLVQNGPLAGTFACNLYAPRHGTQLVVQNCAQRCWAASISFLFNYHGYPTDQDRLASAVFGSAIPCNPAGGSEVLDHVLNSDWTDDHGNPFHARISGMYDPAHGVTSLPNDMVISELTAGRPLLYCNDTHCMVQIGMQYLKDSSGKIRDVHSVQVADPFPGQGFRFLSPAERLPSSLPGGQMTYLAAVTVSS